MKQFQFSKDNLPKHVAIIMDGNGRWAESQGKPRVFGHKNGLIAIRKTISAAAKLDIGVVTLFAFSRENWHRPKEEVEVLMELLITLLSAEVNDMHKHNLCLRIVGDKSRFNKKMQKKIIQAERMTAMNTGMIINIAVNYGGKWDLVETMKRIAIKVNSGEIHPSDISENMISNYLITSRIPEIDLLIRTSGECRVSNFMLWQLAYAEMYFTPVYWPEFEEKNLIDAVTWFIGRERRFGCTSKQVQAFIESE
ncbi:undecaprenyl pyrophosphate synthase [Candidatus Photodesmus katoptron]|uniref:Ditrans,polycis-undecaprenyl-diphosphate synthase ((2E,6E)-farnesyl-diphosphate specific) n=1 Tax=Candidatus Photodesmus katoptron Akat1 TaxID=1236703 RepID=S3E166_9GAMM|nr:isoprenyl transferase [Candidatus Photodesmus katoptron]EPE37926.1 di-trans,poly-cis-decaprenylcistransferase [Candidatus Photodesmus katoptron Akat1]KEY90354.1 undecaprenyl pyrophosphate synthase [Candidatus Photodesmus katoptron]